MKLLCKLSRAGLLLLGFLAVFFMLLKAPIGPDWGWHRRLGEFILDQHQIPRQNLFSYTLPNHLWADSYWLTQVLMVSLERIVGLFGLSVVCALVAALAVGLAVGFNPFASFLVALFLIPLVGVCPLNFGLLLFSLLWLLLRQHKFWVLPFLFVLWANFYANFVLGLLLVFLFFGLETLYLRKISLKFLITPPLCLAATLINPYGIFLWKTLLAEAGSLLMRNNIVEWLSPDAHTDFGFLFFVFLFFVAFLTFRGREKLNLAEVSLIAVFSLMGIFSTYYIPLFAIIVGPFLLRNLEVVSLFPIFNNQRRQFAKLYASVFLAVFALIVGPSVQISKVWLPSHDSKVLAEVGEYPYEAVGFLRVNPQNGNIFNEYVWGGYLIWQLPEVKTFSDGRMPAWREGEEYVFEDYITVTRLKPEWEEVLEKYSVSYFLIKNDSALSQALKAHPKWEIIYEDGLAAVFRKEFSGTYR